MRIYFTVLLSFLLCYATSFSQYGWSTQNSGTNVNLHFISIAYPYSYAWVVGDNGKILATTNSGVNWVAQTSGTINNLNSVHFVTTLKGFAAGNNGTILFTTDGGLNWIPCNSGTNADLYAISFDYYLWPDSVYTIYAAGKNGTVVKTTNFGANWFTQNSGTVNDLRAIYPFDYGSLLIAGANGTILKTVSGGSSWIVINSGSLSQLNSIESIYTNGSMFGALASGNNGAILRSGNNGLNWSPVNSGTSINLNSLTSQYNVIIRAAGANGTILKSMDIGLTWNPEISNTVNNLNSIHFADLNTGWAVGDNGTIMYTTTDNWAVDSRIINANTISTWFCNNGTFNNYKGSSNPGFEWPKGQNHFLRFSSGLWICASVNGDTLTTFASYGTYEYVPGYTDNSGNEHGSNDSLYKIYELHYGINDADRVHWPNALLGNSDQGAPVYYDTTSNSWKPLDMGDQTMFYSYSDNYPLLHQDYTPPLLADIKQLNYAFYAGGNVMTNTIYSQYTVINRSTQAWTNTYITFWSDDDLGNPEDDKSGCDTNMQIGFTYNGLNYDTAYGTAPPAVSLNLVKGTITFTGNNNDTAYLCKGKVKVTKVGYKESKMSVANCYQYGLDPQFANEYQHYMQGFDISGNEIINPLTGKKTKFIFSGDPETNTGWLQSSPYDMRILISVGPITMNPGDTQIIVIAQVVARGTSNVNSVTLLKQYAEVVKENYNNCFSNVPIGIVNNKNQIPSRFYLYQNYPNPFNPKTKIKFSIPLSRGVPEGRGVSTTLTIYDILGRKITELFPPLRGGQEGLAPGTYEAEFDGTNYSSGVYFYKIQAGDFTAVKKMVLLK